MSLDRFVTAQEGSYDAALAELTAGRKQSHWMWWIFPQLASLGRSQRAVTYGIADLAEARAYAAHPILGPRLHATARAVLLHPDTSADEIMGPVDAVKLRSCATLFARADPDAEDFTALLETFYGGAACPLTEDALT